MDDQMKMGRRSSRSTRRWALVAGALSVGTLAVGVAAASADRPEREVTVEQDARLVRLDRVDIPAEFRTPVEDWRDPGAKVPVGWVDQRLVLPRAEDSELAREWCAKPAPVVDEGGRVVGFMFDAYGFVARDEALAEGFSIRALLDEVSDDEAVARTCPSQG